MRGELRKNASLKAVAIEARRREQKAWRHLESFGRGYSPGRENARNAWHNLTDLADHLERLAGLEQS